MEKIAPEPIFERELWRENPDVNSPVIYSTENNSIAIRVDGFLILRTVMEWHELGRRSIGCTCNPPFNTPESNCPVHTKNYLFAEVKALCNHCGGSMVYIRGRYPKQEKRLVCPTCATERLETINELSDKNYGVAVQS